MLSRTGILARNLVRSNVRYHSHHDALPGQNLPFDLGNRYKFTFGFWLLQVTGWGAPYFVVWFLQNKK